VLVNDFGSINIDAELVVGVRSEGDVISLANGCICCNIRDDLVAAVKQVMTRAERPEYVLLEASGVADPSGIALTFMDEDMRDRVRLDSIMCVVDAEQIFAAPEMMELKLRQMAFADMLILNKVDLVALEEIERIRHASTIDSIAIGSSRRTAETCRWTSCCRSGGLIPPDSIAHLRTKRPIIRLTVMMAIVGLTLMGLSTITRRSSGRGATKPKPVFHWQRCGKRRASFPPASIDAKASCIPPKSRAAGSSFRSSASAWISQLETSGMAANRGPGSSPSVRMTA
jgi:hypothetical protein